MLWESTYKSIAFREKLMDHLKRGWWIEPAMRGEGGKLQATNGKDFFYVPPAVYNKLSAAKLFRKHNNRFYLTFERL